MLATLLFQKIKKVMATLKFLGSEFSCAFDSALCSNLNFWQVFQWCCHLNS